MSWLEESASQQRQFCGTWAHSDYSGSHGRRNKRPPMESQCRTVGGNWAAMILCHLKITQRWGQSIKLLKRPRKQFRLRRGNVVIYKGDVSFWLVQINRTQHAAAAPSSGRWRSSSCKNSLTKSFLSPVCAKCQIQSWNPLKWTRQPNIARPGLLASWRTSAIKGSANSLSFWCAAMWPPTIQHHNHTEEIITEQSVHGCLVT